ncbi:hypothetical protein [Mycolicibacterium fortuitum]|uniref:Uncharacterized protein n=1 Tax=Mycolicibacterium fortuitum TaxID=1766 RepID=A0AAE5ABE0_MYCFO|nr:hypothetical protein [Mycolicibacterium fortuitum]MCV7143631.1 hypothetical protein [Mycolicibacterium fortuitum]MDV7190823.1 hypothetical protein [Mycolicibacterium fortuitum]MDV7204029.1 hypothetical protein [Mycolicibacterium fortuitum]MDV7227137.1 hypothetical protein [Mycolicibacterium fortuitum]MDV7261266.1 hypothetical protein [Mycolicibacterium fortuitum]
MGMNVTMGAFHSARTAISAFPLSAGQTITLSGRIAVTIVNIAELPVDPARFALAV